MKDQLKNPKHTTLTAFFELCKKDDFAKTLLYNEVPAFYTWNSKIKIFCKRKQCRGKSQNGDLMQTDAIGRVYTIHPNNDECYFLRLLLHVKKGPTSFLDLKTINGVLYQSYREACIEMGLLENDKNWDNTLTEAGLFSFPKQMRNLFAIIITSCQPSNPKGENK